MMTAIKWEQKSNNTRNKQKNTYREVCKCNSCGNSVKKKNTLTTQGRTHVISETGESENKGISACGTNRHRSEQHEAFILAE